MVRQRPLVIITGGSRGIGAASAKLAASAGWDVLLSYHQDADSAARVCADIEGLGVRADAMQADCAIESDIVNLFERADESFPGALRGLINNAGIVTPRQRLEDYSVERLERIFAINITGAFLCAREAVRRMSSARGGSGGAIVNLSSAASRIGSPNEFIDYAASKGAIDSMTLGLAKEVAAEGIRVNAVRPGLIDTEIHASIGVPDRVAEMSSMIPMQRGGSAEEVAQTIVWLLSDAASYVTGALLDVAGGR